MAKAKVTQLPEDVDEVDDVTEDSSEFLSAKAVAAMLGTDGRTLRKFLRSQRGRVGQGNRWAIDPEEVEEIRIGFEAFNKPKVKETKVIEAPPVDDDELEDLEDLTDEIEDLEELTLD